MVESRICLGPSTSPASNTCPVTALDSGFFDLNNIEGQYLSLYRPGISPSDSTY